MKKIPFIFAFLVLTLGTIAQQVGPNISWDETSFDFGDIKEEAGKVTHKFSFTNTGNEPLVITSVKPSCGCTSSDYTQAPVAPGQKGYVSATFDPLRRPGRFSKSISITTNCADPNTSVKFTGNVIPKPPTVEENYPRQMTELRLKTNHLALMKIGAGLTKTDTVGVINPTDKALKIEFRNVPAHIKVVALPATLQPGKTGVIQVTYDTKIKNDYGFIMDKFTVAVNGNTDQNGNIFTVSATIEDDFSTLTEAQRKNAPKIVFENPVFNFGTLKQGQSATNVFKFSNQGKSDLIIRKTESSCGCAVASPSKQVIKPGESAEISVTFNSAGKTNRQNKTITIINNDPENSQYTLKVTGDVTP